MDYEEELGDFCLCVILVARSLVWSTNQNFLLNLVEYFSIG